MGGCRNRTRVRSTRKYCWDTVFLVHLAPGASGRPGLVGWQLCVSLLYFGFFLPHSG